MSNFVFQLPEGFRVELPKYHQNILYVNYHVRSHNNIEFDERYNYSWYMNNKHRPIFRHQDQGVSGYVNVNEGTLGFQIRMLKNKKVLFVSTFCCFDSWITNDEFCILKDIFEFGANQNYRLEELNSVFSEILCVRVDFQESKFGGIKLLVREVESEKSISLSRNSTVVYDQLRFSLRYSHHNDKFMIIDVFDSVSETRLKLILNLDIAYILTAEFSGAVGEPLFEKICSIASKFWLNDKYGNSEYRSSLRDLIRADPRVYYTGIARHCPIKPIPFRNFGPQERNSETQILYPKCNPVLYRAPSGYFISLKINKVKPPTGTAMFPVFPCCIKSEERRKNNICQIYKDCVTDDEFKRKIMTMLIRVSSTTAVGIGYVGSIYTPLNYIWSASEYLRVRVVDWFEEFNCNPFGNNLDDEDKRMLYRNSRDLGFTDVTTILDYIQEPDHDIRLTYHIFEKISDTRITILIKRPSAPPTRFISKTSGTFSTTKAIIVYYDKIIQGYEVIRKQSSLIFK